MNSPLLKTLHIFVHISAFFTLGHGHIPVIQINMATDGTTEDEWRSTFPRHPPIPADRIIKRDREYHRKMNNQKQDQPIGQGKRNHGTPFAEATDRDTGSCAGVVPPGLIHKTTPLRGASGSNRRQPLVERANRRSISGKPLDCVKIIDKGTPVESNCISTRADQIRLVQSLKFRSIPENRRDSHPSGNRIRGVSFSGIRGGKTLSEAVSNSRLVSAIPSRLLPDTAISNAPKKSGSLQEDSRRTGGLNGRLKSKWFRSQRVAEASG